MNITHDLKIGENYLKNLLSERKKAEIRYNDRDYQIGDILRFYNHDSNSCVNFVITHISSFTGLKEGYVCLSVEPHTEFSLSDYFKEENND